MKNKIYLFVTLFVCSIQFSTSQVLINEYTAANYNNFQDNYNDYEDWVEFYNPTGNNVDLNGYFLSDKANNLTKWQFTSSFQVPANGHAIVFFSGRDEINNNAHTSFKLHQTKGNEWIILTNPNGTTVEDSVWVKRCQANHSRGRETNGSVNWGVFDTPTPNGNNNNAFLGYAEKPSFSIPGGYYNGSATIDINTNTNTNIFFTVNGDFPNNTTNNYTVPVTLNNTSVLKARSYSTNPQILPGFIEYHTYFINDNHTIPIISISGNDIGTLLGGAGWLEPIGTFEIFNSNGQLIDKARGDFNEHGNDSWAYDQRGFDYITRDQLGYNHELEGNLFRTKDRDGYQRLILKAGANDNYPFAYGGSGAYVRDAYCNSLSQVADLRVDERSHEPCIVYVNGQYWGVYDYREKVDDIDFTDYYYDQDDGYVDFLKTWGNTWIEFGTDTGWVNIRDFITNNDMSIAANYTHAKKYFNTGSLIDYYLLNVYTVNADWLNWNTAWWRGTDPDGDKKKWRYALWDFDNTFDHGANYTGIPNTDPDSDPCDPEGMGNVGGQGHIPILNALFDNEDFTADYINRWADLGNSYFSCNFMIQHLDSLIDLIDPEMPAQINTWGGNINTWQNNVQDLKDFILDRCNTINSGIVDCYDVTGPYNVTVIINGIGEVQFSDIFINELNSGWNGEYFGDVNIPAEIVNGNFSYWEIISNGNYIYDPFDPNLTLNLTSDITLIAYFDANGITYLTNPINEGTITENGNIITNFPYSKSYIDGDVINLNGAANTGWEISHWSSSNHNFTPDSVSSDVSITVNGGDTIILHLEKIELTTTILIDPPNSNGEVYLNGDIIESFPKIDVHDYGTNISVSATSNSAWEFDYWTADNFITDGTTSTFQSFNLTDNVTITAHFKELIYHDVEFNVNPENSGTMIINGETQNLLPITKTFLDNTTISVVTIPADGFIFTDWSLSTLDFQPNIFETSGFVNIISNEVITANLKENFEIYVPNAFTPSNGDIRHDDFEITVRSNYEFNVEMKIYDRWGQEVHSINENHIPSEGYLEVPLWDGSSNVNEQQVSEGVYIYTLKVTSSFSGKIIERKGNITIMR